MKCGSDKRTVSPTNGPRRARARVSRRISATRTPICSARSVRAAILVSRSSCRMPPPKLKNPKNLTMMPLPPVCPELNAAENIWQYMRQNYLSNLVFAGYTAIVDAGSSTSPAASHPSRRAIGPRSVSHYEGWYNLNNLEGYVQSRLRLANRSLLGQETPDRNLI